MCCEAFLLPKTEQNLGKSNAKEGGTRGCPR